MSTASEYLTTIENNPDATPEQRTALALTGILATVVEIAAKDGEEEFLRGKWDECDAALGRVLDLANELDGHPGASLKPTAFGDLAARICAAVYDEPTATDRTPA